MEPFGFSPDTQLTLETLASKGALFFGELVQQTRLLPSRIERALAELVAQGYVTADSFEGMRALLVPEEKRARFSATEHRRRHKAVTSIEFAGRWSLLRPLTSSGAHEDHSYRDEAITAFARQLLRRYGVVFRRIMERETLSLTWYELCRTYRRLEAQGEIRGGYFVSGVSGEQFALPEAVGLLRSIRKKPLTGALVPISAADPLNLAGILTPGSRIAAISAHRILLRDGIPTAALKAGQVIPMEVQTPESEQIVARALRIGSLSAALRPYYG
ncbi:MAG: hypothetical protein JO331_02515 [Verrucomicrobia bacterium]|nr:hypothetical protein [Verrucomicrobiota bacterium]